MFTSSWRAIIHYYLCCEKHITYPALIPDLKSFLPEKHKVEQD